MRIVAIIVTLVCCCLMFFVKREWKAGILIIGAMTLTIVNIPSIPLHKANYLLQASFLLSEWNHLYYYFRSLWHTSYLRNLLLLVSGSTLLAAFTTQYVETNEFLQSELLFNYFAFAYAFWAFKDEKSFKPILRISLYCLIVLTVFGVLNYIDKNAMFVNALTEGKTSKILEGVSLGDVYTESSRFRVQSMFKSAFDYGYICVAILMLHLHGLYRRLESKGAFVLALACCSFGILACNCRVVWAGAFISIACYTMWAFQLRRSVLYGIIAVIVFILSYNTVPAVEEQVNKVTDAFVEHSETGGSSIQMRMSQFMYVLIYTEGNEWLGLGKGYWSYTYAQDPDSVGGLHGVESVIFGYLLERGMIGLALWAIFYTIFYQYFRRNRKKNKALAGLGGSILILYLVFSIGTGELGSVYPTMLLLGFAIKAIEYDKAKKLIAREKLSEPLSSSSSFDTNLSVYYPPLQRREQKTTEPVPEKIVAEEPQQPQEPQQPHPEAKPQPETKPQSETKPQPETKPLYETKEDKPKRFLRWAAILLSVLAIGAVKLGNWEIGRLVVWESHFVPQATSPNNQTTKQPNDQVTSPNNQTTKQPNDQVTSPNNQTTKQPNDQVTSPNNQTTKQPNNQMMPVVADVPEWEKYNKMDYRLSVGGYYITGLDRIVKARAGDNAKKIAKRVYGSAEGCCYIEVYNGIKATTELEKGREIKIPKLESKQSVRKRLKQSEKAGKEKPVASESPNNQTTKQPNNQVTFPNNQTTKQPNNQMMPVATDEPEWEKYNKMDYRLSVGGYYIVGLDRIVKARAGDNAKKIAKRVYGSAEGCCYIEVYNGIKATTELEEGREIKIPKLESKQSVRKKLKQQTSAKH